MFTGIIEAVGTVESVKPEGSNKIFYVSSVISRELKVDQSLSHNGVCLTVEAVNEDVHRVTAIEETLLKSNLRRLQTGDLVNLERCLQFNGRIDGHIVQGHVDTTAVCISKKPRSGSMEYRFQLKEERTPFIVEKGSISLNGVSLTIYNVSKNAFSVSIIPYTLEHTNLNDLAEGMDVNIEYDIIGKYILRNLQLNEIE